MRLQRLPGRPLAERNDFSMRSGITIIFGSSAVIKGVVRDELGFFLKLGLS